MFQGDAELHSFKITETEFDVTQRYSTLSTVEYEVLVIGYEEFFIIQKGSGTRSSTVSPLVRESATALQRDLPEYEELDLRKMVCHGNLQMTEATFQA
jgi:hypothetical protein